MTRSQFIKQAQSERYAWAKKVDAKAVAAFENYTRERRVK